MVTKEHMLPKELFAHVRRIEITTRKLVNDIFAGQYNSVFKGRGMEFAEVREYQLGDDIRSIDWNVTARMGHPYIKRNVEERELTVMLMVDMSASLRFGTSIAFKERIAAEIASVIAFSAIKNNDKVGMIIFTNHVEKYIIPHKGRQHILRLIREILYFTPQQKITDMNAALEYLNDVMKRKAVVFLISDFECSNFEQLLRVSGKHHDLISIVIRDQREREIPRVGIVQLKDNETGVLTTINTNGYYFQKYWKEQQQEKQKTLEKMFTKAGLDYISISTDISYIKPLISFFRTRERRLR